MPSRFHFTALATVPGMHQVRLDSPAGQLLGTVRALEHGWQATVVVAGKLHTQPFPDREDAAAWLLGLAPRAPKTGG